MQYKQYKDLQAKIDVINNDIDNLTIELKQRFKFKENGLLANNKDLTNKEYIGLKSAIDYKFNLIKQLNSLTPTKLKSKYHAMHACELNKPRYKDNKQALKWLAIENKGA